MTLYIKFEVLTNLVGTLVLSCRVHTTGESLLQGSCWSWMGGWWLTWAMMVVLAPSFTGAAHGVGTALRGERGFQPCKQSVINPSKGSDVPPCPPHKRTKKILSCLQARCFLRAPFPSHFNWISATSWMVLERRSVAYCAKKIERVVQMGSLCFPLLCHYYMIFFFPVPVIFGSAWHLPATSTCELQWWPSLVKRPCGLLEVSIGLCWVLPHQIKFPEKATRVAVFRGCYQGENLSPVFKTKDAR